MLLIERRGILRGNAGCSTLEVLVESMSTLIYDLSMLYVKMGPKCLLLFQCWRDGDINGMV